MKKKRKPKFNITGVNFSIKANELADIDHLITFIDEAISLAQSKKTDHKKEGCNG